MSEVVVLVTFGMLESVSVAAVTFGMLDGLITGSASTSIVTPVSSSGLTSVEISGPRISPSRPPTCLAEPSSSIITSVPAVAGSMLPVVAGS